MMRPTHEERGEEKLERSVFYLDPADIQRIQALERRLRAASFSHAGRLVVLAGLQALEKETERADEES